ncbi:hypothetical protein L218DRAFT_999804 [Marasmius fiardii PR-910]|nr:hypothetical protein L218DRAFT_999804 [Marasmius fiardii PR-910]
MNSTVDDAEHVAAPFLTFDEVVTLPLSTLSVMFVIYGIYIVIWGQAVRILYRPDGPSSKLYMGWTISLFVLATLYTATYVWGSSHQAAILFYGATKEDYSSLLNLLDTDKMIDAWL